MHKYIWTLVASATLLVSVSPFMFRSFLTNRQPNKTNTQQARSLIDGQPNLTYSSKTNSLKKHVENQWALKDISILKAWEQTKGDKNLVVAVIDTGIHTRHSCLRSNLWANPNEIPNNNIDDDNNGFVDDIHGWNFVNNNNKIQDHHGHGTHIAGLIAATGNTPENPNCKVIGVAPNVKLMILKYYDDYNNNKNVENTILSIKYAIEQGAHIINYSGGGPGSNEEEKSLIAQAADKGIIFVSASGNESSEIGKTIDYYPASYGLPNILYVQSKNAEHEIINSSNWVSKDYRERKTYQTAPGERVISTLPPKRYLQGNLLNNMWRSLASKAEINQDSYGYLTGTSQATAVATGVVALVKSRYPFFTMQQVINQVVKTGFDPGNEKIQEKTKEGKKLNAVKALNMRDSGFDINDTSVTNVMMPATNEPHALKNLYQSKGRVDVYKSENNQKMPEKNTFNLFQQIRQLSKKK